MTLEKILTNQKNRIIQIINGFEVYYDKNYLEWDSNETTIAQKILGVLIITFKKTEDLEAMLPHFEKNNLIEMFILEVEKVIIITDFYYDVFVSEKTQDTFEG